jgi:hypothetical protein
MRIPKIYLETTVFNFYADKERFAHADTVRLFKEVAEGKYLAYTSRSVIEELERAPAGKRDEMVNIISEYNIPILEYNDEAERLADIYVTEGVIPVKYRMDGLHIAIAAVNDLDMIISMNFQHIVKRKTIKMTANINILNGYHAIEIYSPMEVVENETNG